MDSLRRIGEVAQQGATGFETGRRHGKSVAGYLNQVTYKRYPRD